MTAASNPKFARKLLDLRLINKAPLKHAHDDEVESGPDLLHLMKAYHYFAVDIQLSVQFPMGRIPSLCISARGC